MNNKTIAEIEINIYRYVWNPRLARTGSERLEDLSPIT